MRLNTVESAVRMQSIGWHKSAWGRQRLAESRVQVSERLLHQGEEEKRREGVKEGGKEGRKDGRDGICSVLVRAEDCGRAIVCGKMSVRVGKSGSAEAT